MWYMQVHTQVHARTMVVVHACTMATVHACTMVIVYACIIRIVLVSCPTWLMLEELQGGGSQGKVHWESKKVWEAASPPIV